MTFHIIKTYITMHSKYSVLLVISERTRAKTTIWAGIFSRPCALTDTFSSDIIANPSLGVHHLPTLTHNHLSSYVFRIFIFK